MRMARTEFNQLGRVDRAAVGRAKPGYPILRVSWLRGDCCD
jgi:hypothetical protein